MVGAITTRDVLLHPIVTVRCFGWRIFFKSIISPREQTFLGLLQANYVTDAHKGGVAEIVGQCVDLERQAGQIYRSLARGFRDDEPVANLFATLARQEQQHAELLRLCGLIAEREGWDAADFIPWEQIVPRLMDQLCEVAAVAATVSDRLRALELALEIESSEINYVFFGVVAATKSDFVRSLQAFHATGREHIEYLCREAATLEPSLADACTVLRERQIDSFTPGRN
jgi:hypothetical protein